MKDRFDFQDSLLIDTVYHFIKKIKKSIDKAICCMIYLLSNRDGVLAQLGEHLLCTKGVIGSIPIRSTMTNSVELHILIEFDFFHKIGKSYYKKHCKQTITSVYSAFFISI